MRQFDLSEIPSVILERALKRLKEDGVIRGAFELTHSDIQRYQSRGRRIGSESEGRWREGKSSGVSPGTFTYDWLRGKRFSVDRISREDTSVREIERYTRLPSVCLCLCMSTYLSVCACLSVSGCMYLYASLNLHMCIRFFICVLCSVCLSVWLVICLPVCLVICPSFICLSVRVWFSVQWCTKCAVMNENVQWWKAVCAVMN